jgi:hypothetical protein
MADRGCFPLFKLRAKIGEPMPLFKTTTSLALVIGCLRYSLRKTNQPGSSQSTEPTPLRSVAQA